jgi:hypothetical protein
MYPASGYGRQSAYYDADILLDGTYQIQSVTLDSSSLDLTNYADNKILRVGLLIVKSAAHGGRYVPLNTADGYLNGAVPTHFMPDVVVLAREEHIQYDYIMGLKRKRVIQAKNRVVPVYHHCHIYDTKIFYNNSDLVQITEAQWQKCQRIILVPPQIAKFVSTETGTRALYWNLGDEEILTEYNIN